MSRFVQPETRTLTLANGDTLTVRARLTAGEARAQWGRHYDEKGTLIRNPALWNHSLVAAYLLDWSFKNGHGEVVSLRDKSLPDIMATVDALDEASFEEVVKAIDAHVSAMNAERAAEKKTDGGMGS
jgi:hypothetical protein